MGYIGIYRRKEYVGAAIGGRTGTGRWRGHQPERAQMVAGARAGPFGAMGRAQAIGAQWGAGQGVAAGEAGHGHGAREGREDRKSVV